MKYKYIIFDRVGSLFDVPIIFPSFLNHLDMAEKFGGVENVVSAGFVEWDGFGEVHCWGESNSLKKKSKPHIDSGLISRAGKFD